MMQRRLFWKILLGFWLTFLLSSQLLWLGFTLYDGGHQAPPEESVIQRMMGLQMSMAESALHDGGLPALDALVAKWPQSERGYLRVMSTPGADGGEDIAWAPEPPEWQSPLALTPPDLMMPPPPDGRGPQPPEGGKRGMAGPDAPAVKSVIGPDGERYQLAFDAHRLREQVYPQRPMLLLNIPEPLVWIAGLGGLLFSGLLAWNLTRPLNRLRASFDRVAQGDLSIRLLPDMKRRHDELSDVARDFDAMVERLDVLVSSREQLLHDVSHELRSPLARLQLAIGLAHQNHANIEPSLQRIEREASRMDKMIGELLALSRSEHQVVDDTYFDLLGLVTAVVNDARFEAQVPGVTILLNADETQDHTVKGNPELMRRALDNIIRNALRFSTHAQTVTVTLSGNDREWTISVADQGPGVEKTKLSSIFDPFIRIESPQSGKGYGLGLAIARKVVMAHGGHIEADNGEQGGLIVRISIPRWREAQR